MFNRKLSSRKLSLLSILGVMLALAFNPQGGASAQAPAILYATPAGTGNCSSWATACTLINALNSAVSGDEIWVAAGVHRPTSAADRSATFQLKSGVAVYGGFAGTETARDQRNPTTNITTLSGDLLGDDVGFTNNAENVYHVVMGANNALLDGFTITGGNANGTAVPDDTGGGMFIYQRNTALTNLIFFYNTASSLGGGLYIDNGTPTLTNVTFANNTAVYGGGMNSYASSPTLDGVTFSVNVAQSAGGGLIIWSGGSATLANVTFSGNQATDRGGGMVIEAESNATLTNVTFSGNQSTDRGGGMVIEAESNATLTQVTLVGNLANHGGGIYNLGSTPAIRNSIFWNNTASIGGAQIYNSSTASTVSDSLVQDGCPTGSTCTNILTADPLLGTLGNYGGFTRTIPLLLGSAAIDSGNDAVCPATDQRGIARPQGAHCDIGAYEFVNLAPTDISLSNSTVAENAAVDTLVGNLSSVDPDPDNTFTYSLVSGSGDTDNASFNISGGALRTSAVFDYETRASYSVRIRTTDQGGLWFEESFTITVTNVNETPTGVLLSNSAVLENSAIGTPVGNLASADPDSGNTFTYSLVSGSGDTDNASFDISGDALHTAEVFDYETRSSYSVRIRTTDQGALWYEGAFTITITDGNEFPTDIQLSNSIVPENAAINTTVGNLTSTDPDPGNTFTYSLATGAGDTDNASFNISGGALRTLAVFDYETRASYSVRIRTTDQGGLWFEKAFTITISDVNDPPVDILLSNNTVTENAAINTSVGNLSSVDPDAGNTFTYSLATGAGDTDNASFNISGNSLRTSVLFDFESQPSYTIRIRTTDQGGLYYEEALTISISNVNETPTDIFLSNGTVAENAALGTPVGNLSSLDPDAGNTFTYNLVSGSGDADNAAFVISDDSLRTAAVYDYETRSSYSVRIRTTDQGGLWYEESFTITISNVNETPIDILLSNSTVAENAAIGTPVGVFSSTDPDAGNTFTYSLVSGAGDADNAVFNISDDSLGTAAVFDYESRSSYSVRIRTTDQGGLYYEEAFTITITDGNDPPVDLLLSNSTVTENAAADTLVGNLSSIDPDPGGTFTYGLVSGSGDTNNASFQISGNALRTAAVFDFETQASYTVRIRTTDPGGLYYEEVFTITVTDVNETPSDIQLSHSSVSENAALGTPVGNLSSLDPDAGNTFTYSLASGTGDADNASFNISGDTLRTAAVFDFEIRSSYSVRIRTTDPGGLWYEEVFAITIGDGNEAPTDILLSNQSVAENAAIGAPVGSLSSGDPDAGNTFTYSLVSGSGDADNASFHISGNSLLTAAAFDFETRSSYTVRIRTTDQGGLGYEEAFTITIGDANDAPLLAAIANATLDEIAAFTFTASATDADAGAALTFNLTGSVPAGASIQSVSGIFAWTPGEAQGPAVYTFTVQVCDNGAPSLCDQQEITLTVQEVNLAPVAEDDSYSMSLNQTLSLPAPGVLANDLDADLPPNSLIAVKVSDPAHGTLTLNADGSFTYQPGANWYGEDHFTYQTFDGLQSSATATVTIRVTPLMVFIPVVFR